MDGLRRLLDAEPRGRWKGALFALACLWASLSPLLPVSQPAGADAQSAPFPGWPAVWADRPLRELALSARERTFASGFPGRIGRFSDGEREIILRWVTSPTRLLHPASDCFRGLGYAIEPRAMQRDPEGRPMACFMASRGNDRLSICELIVSEKAESWPDVSSWYWSAVFGNSTGPWWSIVTASAIPVYEEQSTTH